MQGISTVYSVAGSSHILCVVFENSFGVVGWERTELKCYVCSGLLASCCDHVREVSKVSELDCEIPDFVEGFVDARLNTGGSRPSWVLRAKSYMAIPFHLPERLKQILFETSECQIVMNDEGACLIPTIPEATSKFSVCPSCGSAW